MFIVNFAEEFVHRHEESSFTLEALGIGESQNISEIDRFRSIAASFYNRIRFEGGQG